MMVLGRIDFFNANKMAIQVEEDIRCLLMSNIVKWKTTSMFMYIDVNGEPALPSLDRVLPSFKMGFVWYLKSNHLFPIRTPEGIYRVS